MNRPDPVRPRPAESGFVLIGVVIFVVALTIIGISLFSLSSYEAQFLERSLDGEQAFQSAVGGVERARFLLCERSRLDSVALLLPGSLDVVAASAVQYLPSGDSLTTVADWSDPANLVRLRVTARVNDRERTVQADYVPGQAADYYRRLVTVGGGITVPPLVDGMSRWHTARLVGAVWESSGASPNAWANNLDPPRPAPILTSPGVIVPEAVDFIARHAAAPSPPWGYPYVPLDSTLAFTLDCGSDPIGFWTTDGTNPDWSLYVGYMSEAGGGDPRANRTRILVDGSAVWMFPRGAQFQHQVQVQALPGGSVEDCLVIVAGDRGIRFLGGIQAAIPVILVSSGQVAIRHENDYGGASVNGFAVDLSVFARSFDLVGPVTEYTDPATGIQYHNHTQLDHPVDGALDRTFVPLLAAGGALPNAITSTGHTLTLRSPTWRASAP
jgi:hypothetical protein